AERQPADANGAVNLQIRVRDPKFQPLDNATVSVEVQPVVLQNGRASERSLASAPVPATNSIRIPAEPALGEPGLYVATYVPRLTAGYRATAFVTNSAGVGSATAPSKPDSTSTNSLADFRPVQTGWSCDLAAEEFRALPPNI